MNLYLSSSPHIRQKRTTSEIMRLVLLFTLPGIATQIYFFGWGTLIHLLLAITVALVAEACILEVRKKNIEHALKDNSAIVTALLLAVAIPPFSPWWITVVGTIFAIVIAKQLYGGLGQNIFNPAMVAYVVLLISFPVQMTAWSPTVFSAEVSQNFADAWSIVFTQFSVDGYSIEQMRAGVDGHTMATPLDHLKTSLTNGLTLSEAQQSAVYIQSAGMLNGFGEGWFWVNFAYLIGGLALLQVRVINWHLPFSMLAGLFIAAMLFYLVDSDRYASPLFHLFSGGTMLAAFFIVTDPVTAATSNKGRIYYGLSIGFLIYAIRTWGNYPDAVAFAVLLLNMAVPFIDYYTVPRTYGHKEAKKMGHKEDKKA